MFFRSRLWLVVFAFLVAAVAVFFAHLYLNNNFHVVYPNQVYRSSQMSQQALLDAVEKYKIKTVINLRGKHPEDLWYRNEMRASLADHIIHIDLSLPAHGLPTNDELIQLMNLLETAKKPFIIHCHAGADRTGLASAMVMILAGDKNKTEITKQASWRYGAVSPTSIGHEVLKNYYLYLQQSKKSFGRASFVAWVNAKPKLKRHFGWFF